ncbi:MAG: hypothetical protein RL223_2762 [Pseudomonadota bacterium]
MNGSATGTLACPRPPGAGDTHAHLNADTNTSLGADLYGHASTDAAWQALAAPRLRRLLAAALLLLACVLADLATGPALLAPLDVLRALAGDPVLHGTRVIVWEIRLPVALMAVAVGAALGLSGVVMQTVLHNPLASPYTLGISAGAGFGAALAIVAGGLLPLPPAVAVPLAAFAFAGLGCWAVLRIGRAQGGDAQGFVLAGIALLFLFQALLSLLQYLASPEALQQIVFWLFGSLYKATRAQVGVLAGVLALCTPWLLAQAWRLTALQLSDERAASLGVDVSGLRWRCLAVVSLLTGTAVAFVGTIGFIGLIAPHIARALWGEDHRHLLPGAALCGALLLSGASVLGKLISPGALIPIGIVTACLGVPFFLVLVMRKRSEVAW